MSILRICWLLALAGFLYISIAQSPFIGIIGLAVVLVLAAVSGSDGGNITPRGAGLLIAIALITVAAATIASVPMLAILGLTLLAWFLFEWCLFTCRARFALAGLQTIREVRQGNRTVRSGWAGQPFHVRFTVRNPSGWHCPLLVLQDIVSVGSDSECRTHIAALGAKGQASGEYAIGAAMPGVLYFAGMHATLSDLAGFFRAEAFLAHATTITVLPRLSDDEGRQRAVKRFNALPPPGMHRLRWPGSGSELLDLRDYQPGDPPKMIAWKPSARRDRLIIREYESDVPVRCTLLLDVSNRVRLGTTVDTPLARLAAIAAGIAQAAMAHRDFVGLTCFDAGQSHVIGPARTPAHAIAILNALARACGKLPEIPKIDPDVLNGHLEPLLRKRRPTFFDTFANSRPWGLYWRPLLDADHGWLIFLPYLLTPYLAVQNSWLNEAVLAARSLNPGTGRIFIDLPVFLLVFATMTCLPSTLASFFWLCFGLSGYIGPRRRSVRTRKQIAAIFAADDADSPAAIERYLLDDAAYAERAGRYFASEHIRIAPRLFDSRGLDRFLEPEKIGVAARALTAATARARDNELYVILADLLAEMEEIEPLIIATRMARARHHRVLLILHWPHDVPLKRPDREREPSVKSAVLQAIIDGTHDRYQRLRKRFTAAGATVMQLGNGDSFRPVLEQLDRLRGARSRR